MAKEAPLAPAIPGGIALGSFSQAKRHYKRYDAVLTAEDPQARPPHKLRTGSIPQLVLPFEDVDTDNFGILTATRDQVSRAIDFARTHVGDALLVHCFHGIGRSAALAYAIAADRLGAGCESEALASIVTMKWDVRPNLIVVGHADDVLGRNGALMSALRSYEADRPQSQQWRKMRHDAVVEQKFHYARRPAAAS